MPAPEGTARLRDQDHEDDPGLGEDARLVVESVGEIPQKPIPKAISNPSRTIEIGEWW